MRPNLRIFIGFVFFMVLLLGISLGQRALFKNELGFEKAQAGTTPGAWEYVREAATWARLQTRILEEVLHPIVKSGFFAQATTTTADTGDAQWTARLTVAANSAVTASAYSGSRVFKNKFEMWRKADGAKALEIYFDDASSFKSSAILMFVRLKLFTDSASYSAKYSYRGQDIVSEIFTFGNENARIQTFTFSGGSIEEEIVLEKGRVVIEQKNSGLGLQMKGVVRVKSTALLCGDSSNPKYYGFSLVQDLTAGTKKPATAMFSLSASGVDGLGLNCGATNSSNLGLFSADDSFVSQGNTSVPSGYPSASDVQALMALVGATGAGTYDDTSLSAIGSWSIAFKNLNVP